MNSSLRERIQFAYFCTIHRRSLLTIYRWQEKHFRQIVRHAFLNVPLWREIFLKAHIDGEHIGGLENLSKIPLTSKTTYIGRMTEEYIDSSRHFVQEWRTRLNTGEQSFRFLLAKPYIDNLPYIGFATFRFLLWNSGIKKNIATTRIARIKQKRFSSTFRLGIPFSDFQTNPKEVCSRLAEFKPEVLIAYPLVLFDLAKMLEDDKTLPPLTPRYILSSGGELTPSVRSFVSEQLGCAIYDQYVLEEIGVIGTECSIHDGFHINSESIIVEITDESGKPLSEGEYGKVVVTDLLNYNMPFIRYDTGDQGIITFKPCTCGIYTPRLWLKSE